MLCSVCREGIEGIWEPAKTKRVGLVREFPDIVRLLHPYAEEDHEFEEILGELYPNLVVIVGCLLTRDIRQV